MLWKNSRKGSEMEARSGRYLDFVNFASNPYSFELKANFELFQLLDFSVLERPEQQPNNACNQNSSDIEKIMIFLST